MNDSSANAHPNDPRVQAALRDYLERVDRGEPIDLGEFLSQNAEIAEPLRSFIAAEDVVRKLAAAESPGIPLGDSTRSFMAHAQETHVRQPMDGQSTRSRAGVLSGQFGRYRILKTLGQGAMGAVYLAEDTQLNRQVALKTPHFSDDPSEETLERFYREARAAAMLRNAHICPVFDVGEIDGAHYLSMAYIAGHPLSAFIQPEKPQAERQVAIAVRKLALALHEAHEHGIVHRDLKPANIMVDKKGEPIIMDFGLAWQVGRDEDVRLTQQGVVMGTPAFMSPEQIEGDPDKVGPPTDQYSLGVILYELLTGQLPFRGALLAVMGQILTQDVVPPGQLRNDLDPRIESVCLKMMAKSPADRFASMSAVADELEKILRNPIEKAAPRKEPTLPPQRDPSARTVVMKSPVSQSAASLKIKAVAAESDLAALEASARTCLARRDYEQAIGLIERVPEDKRTPLLQALLKKAYDRADQVALLICHLDEAVRRGDEPTATRKAAELLKLKPGHPRAQIVEQELAARGKTEATRIGLLRQLAQDWDKGDWIRRSMGAAGAAVFGLALWAVIVYLPSGKAVLKIQIDDPNVEVAVKGSTVVLKAPGHELEVQPGATELAITQGDLHFTTKSFTLKRGEHKTVTVSLVDSKVAAKLGDELLGERPINASPQGPARVDVKTTVAKTDSPASLIAPFDPGEAQAARTAWARSCQVEEKRTNSLGMQFALVPPGTFHMGAPSSQEEPSSKDDERPRHRVQLTRPYYLGICEVTQQDYERVTGRNPSLFQRGDQVQNSDTRRFPVETVTWFDAVHFCNQLSSLENRSPYYAISSIQRNDDGSIKDATVTIAGGNGYRLPSEAQWEYACRAGTTMPFHFGQTNNSQGANVDGENPYGTEEKGPLVRRPMEVGSYAANAFDLRDMHGNVWEWCQDWYDATYYEHSVASDPQGPEAGERRVERGGCYLSHAEFSRCAARTSDRPDVRAAGTGFRVALDIEVGKTDAVQAAAPARLGASPALVDRKEYTVITGDWRVEGEQLVQTVRKPHREIMFGDVHWTDYDFTVDAMRIGPGDSFTLFFRRPNRKAWENQFAFDVAGRNNRQSWADICDKGHVEQIQHHDFPLVDHHWYTARVKVRGSHFECFVNDGHKEVKLIDADDDRHPNGCVGLRTWNSEYRFRNIKVTAPDGTVLWEGLPEIGAPAANAPATSDAGAASKVGSGRSPFFVQGDWKIQGEDLVKFRPRPGKTEIEFGDPKWKDYDFSVEVLREQGDRMCSLTYRCADHANRLAFHIAGWRNHSAAEQEWNNGIEATRRKGPCALENNRWYTALVKVRGNKSQAYLDENLLFEHEDHTHPAGGVGLGANPGVFRFRHIKVVAPDGTVLWQGLPELPSKTAGSPQSSAISRPPKGTG